MAIHKTPGGSRGARVPPDAAMRIMKPVLGWMHRRTGDRFNGMDILHLTTTGARSGKERTSPVARFDDGAGGWYVIASWGGAAQHPAWYHNVAAHPDQVWAEVSGARRRVRVAQLEGAERDRVWQDIAARYPQFKGYASQTDRVIPVLRLTPES